MCCCQPPAKPLSARSALDGEAVGGVIQMTVWVVNGLVAPTFWMATIVSPRRSNVVHVTRFIIRAKVAATLGGAASHRRPAPARRWR